MGFSGYVSEKSKIAKRTRKRHEQVVRQGQKEVPSMKARRYELTDKEWELVRPLIQISHTGRPQKDICAHLNGILWLARSGAR